MNVTEDIPYLSPPRGGTPDGSPPQIQGKARENDMTFEEWFRSQHQANIVRRSTKEESPIQGDELKSFRNTCECFFRVMDWILVPVKALFRITVPDAVHFKSLCLLTYFICISYFVCFAVIGGVIAFRLARSAGAPALFATVLMGLVAQWPVMVISILLARKGAGFLAFGLILGQNIICFLLGFGFAGLLSSLTFSADSEEESVKYHSKYILALYFVIASVLYSLFTLACGGSWRLSGIRSGLSAIVFFALYIPLALTSNK
jgi:hypothetical protein